MQMCADAREWEVMRWWLHRGEGGCVRRGLCNEEDGSPSVLELARSAGRYEGCKPVCEVTLRLVRRAMRPFGRWSCALFGPEVRESGWLLMLVCWRLWELWEAGGEEEQGVPEPLPEDVWRFEVMRFLRRKEK